MPLRKNLKKGISRSPQEIKRKNSSYFIKRYLLGVLVACIAFIVIGVVMMEKNGTASSCANSKTCKSDLSLRIENNTLGTFAGKTVHPPQIYETSDTSVLGVSSGSGEKHIFVDLSTQTLTAYEGSEKVLETFVSTGKWNRTPVGNFNIWTKLRATRMAGGEGADYYNLPNVPYVMYFYRDFGLHGAYWHNNFGYPMSHGCINMRQIDAKVLFEWADGPRGGTPGTEVSVCNSITSDKQCIQNNPVR
jgi:hypothetical protein